MEGGSSGASSCMVPFGDNKNNTSANGVGGQSPFTMMPLMTPSHHHHQQQQQQHQHPDSNTLFFPLPITNSHQESYLMENNNNNNDTDSSVRTKILAHPYYPRLLNAYVKCQKVGAPPEVVARLDEACASSAAIGSAVARFIGEDPALDQFMEAYCEMLTKYEQELTKPFNEAMLFLQRVECQFKTLSLSSSHSAGVSGDALERNASSEEEEEEDVDVSNSFVDAQADDRELKGQLLRRYSGYLGSLKQEFMKKRKKGKLPKEARQQLLDWWNRHYKWPYPSESQKMALADSTGLNQKQINNWFINQRKRHWKPSEDMQFVVMDAPYPHNIYVDNVLANPFTMDISPTLL